MAPITRQTTKKTRKNPVRKQRQSIKPEQPIGKGKNPGRKGKTLGRKGKNIIKQNTGYKGTQASREYMMYAIASMLTSNNNFSHKLQAITKLFKDELGINLYRSILTGGNADSECKKARERGSLLGINGPASGYIHATARSVGQGSTSVTGVNTFMYSKDENKKMGKTNFTATGQGNCGRCWLCGLMVRYYLNSESVTSCGQCEHIGAIIASSLTGMLTSSNLNIQIYNYGSSHVHCNQKKKNTISMKFDTNMVKWVHDREETNKMIKNIVDTPMHGDEYDPSFRDEFKKSQQNISHFKTRIRENIEFTTDNWINVANQSIRDVTKGRKMKAFALLKLVEDLTIQLMKTIPKLTVSGGSNSKTLKLKTPMKSKTLKSKTPTKSSTSTVIVDYAQNNNNNASKDTVNDYSQNNASTVTQLMSISKREEEKRFITLFNKKTYDIVKKIHELLEDASYINENFLENLIKARKKNPDYDIVNKELKEFNDELNEKRDNTDEIR